ncbi:L-serine ammonia-lyase [Synergistaceae bacterium OttesenSCG-928-I11]|nr:L-serine ammonia-lyase [Synergistaceae bacterium OttesenSCG-928-I11]
MISVLDIFRPGIGPSSSHTVGPMRIAGDFARRLRACAFPASRIVVELYGSLALTGRGHGTEGAVLLGLAGYDPSTVDVDAIPEFIRHVRDDGLLPLAGGEPIAFEWGTDFVFHAENLPCHENGMVLCASGGEASFEATYYSTGGGFFCRAEAFEEGVSGEGAQTADIPFPYDTSEELIALCEREALSLSGLVGKNEEAVHGAAELDARLAEIWRIMRESIERGMRAEGLLPGALRVPRRAIGLWRRLKGSGGLSNDPMVIIDWVNLFALAVSEENAAGGRVVTAPTNGACGIVPAVLAYYDKFVAPADADVYSRYLLAGGAIGAIYKRNASISGAEVGCQGEVGVACSMAAAGLAELMGGSPRQVCSAAEIAMEHNLGLTCDPVGGLVQVPCIERNAIMAVQAINAARMALLRTTAPRVSLDKVIETMYETGRDMNAKYRETSEGGLAKSVKCE